MKKNEAGKEDYQRAFEEAKSAERGLNFGYFVTPLDFAHDEQIAVDFIKNILSIYFFSGLNFLRKNVEQNELSALVLLYEQIIFNTKILGLVYCPEKDTKKLLKNFSTTEYVAEDLFDQMKYKKHKFVFSVNKFDYIKHQHYVEDNLQILTEEFAFLAKDNPIAALLQIIIICSLTRDLLFDKMRHSFEKDSFERADAFVAQFLIWVLQNYPDFALSVEQENVLKKYPHGIASLSLDLDYDGYNLPLQTDMIEINSTFVSLAKKFFYQYIEAVKNFRFFSRN